MRFKFFLAALAATTAFASPALAQTAKASATAEAHGLVLERLTLTKVADLDFGTIISSAVSGTVVINPDTGARTVGGGVTPVPTNVGHRGLFGGAGTIGQNYVLTLSSPSVLVSTTNAADTVGVTSMVLDSANVTARTIGASGAFQVGVGGTFAIAAGQPNGFYKADFTLTADYQ